MIRGSRIIYIVHHSPGRLRLRLPWLRDHAALGTPLADALAAIGGMDTVEVRPYTGSILCLFDPQRTGESAIVDAVRNVTGIDIVARPGAYSAVEEAELARTALREGNAIARAAVGFFKGVNLDVLRFTEGRIDLGTLVAGIFATAGAVEVVVTGKLPVPPWSQLAWWAFRTFTTLEGTAIHSVEIPQTPGAAEAEGEGEGGGTEEAPVH